MLKVFLYPDVILRTSIFPALMGAIIAVYAGVADMSWHSYCSFIAIIIGILILQGVIEHGMDVLKDKGGFSAFRPSDITDEEERKIRRSIVAGTVILFIIGGFLLSMWRPWLIIIGLMALRSAKLYVESHNEWYSVFGFMLSFSVGYFAFTNYPTTAWWIGAMIVGFLMKTSQSMYRLDDYLGDKFDNNSLTGEFKHYYQLIQYYRNVFRSTVHIVPLLIIGLLLFIHTSIGVNLVSNTDYVVYGAYIVGFVVFIAQFFKLENKMQQEVNLAPIFAAMVFSEIYTNYPAISVEYIIAVIIATYAFTRFWINRHAMCNILVCTQNPLREVKIPK